MNDKLKICQIITQTHFGGAQKYICDISNNLNDNFDITIAYGEGNEQELKDHITNNYLKFKKLKHLKRNINLFKDMLAFFELYSFFKKNKFDIIHLHSSKAGFIASIAGKLSGIKKIIYTAHGWVFKEDLSRTKKIFYLYLEKISALFKTKIICVSKDDYNLAIKNKICKKEKLELIYNGFLKKESLKKSIAREFVFKQINKWDNDQIIIGTISNLYKNKGINLLIKSAEILNKKYDNLIFVVFGNGPEEQNLKELIKNLNIQNFYFLGFVKDSYKYLTAFDIFTLSSIKEGLPYTILEALNASNLIVCSNLESLTEVIQNNANGAVFESGNVNDLMAKIELLINDKKLGQKFIKNGPRGLEKFDFDKFINKIKENYLSSEINS